MKNTENSEPKDSVTLLREYAAIRVFHADTFSRARTLMRNSADEIDKLRAFRTALEQIRDGKIIQGMSPSLFATHVLSQSNGASISPEPNPKRGSPPFPEAEAAGGGGNSPDVSNALSASE